MKGKEGRGGRGIYDCWPRQTSVRKCDFGEFAVCSQLRTLLRSVNNVRGYSSSSIDAASDGAQPLPWGTYIGMV